MHLNKPKPKLGPRKESSRYQSILTATRELVEEVGYRKLTIKAIASRAGVSRNLIYNWWEGDLHLLIEEAVLPNVNDWPQPNTGALEADLEQFIEMTIDALYTNHVLAGYLELVCHVVDKPEALQRTSKKFRNPYARLLGKILQNAEQRGDLQNTDTEERIHYTILAQIISGCVLQFSITKKLGKRKLKAMVLHTILKLL